MCDGGVRGPALARGAQAFTHLALISAASTTRALAYHVEGLAEARLRELLRQAGLRPRDVLRVREPLVVELGLVEREVPDDELLRLMAEHPELAQRPIVQRGDRAVLARPPERVLELL